MSLPPHYVDEKKKEVVFHLKGGYPVTMAIPTWMQSFPDDYKSIVVSSLDEFKKYGGKV